MASLYKITVLGNDGVGKGATTIRVLYILRTNILCSSSFAIGSLLIMMQP